jgi:hypothetical protein
MTYQAPLASWPDWQRVSGPTEGGQGMARGALPASADAGTGWPARRPASKTSSAGPFTSDFLQLKGPAWGQNTFVRLKYQ